MSPSRWGPCPPSLSANNRSDFFLKFSFHPRRPRQSRLRKNHLQSKQQPSLSQRKIPSRLRPTIATKISQMPSPLSWKVQSARRYMRWKKATSTPSLSPCSACHSAVKRVESSAQRIALQIRGAEGEIRRSFERPDGMSVIAEKGEQMLLVAVVRGQPNELIIADLEFSLRRIEEHFEERFAQAGSALMHALQPFLEDCLLIQAPASAA